MNNEGSIILPRKEDGFEHSRKVFLRFKLKVKAIKRRTRS